MVDLVALGERLRRARLNAAARRGRDLSQAEVGRALGVTGVTVGRWEAGGAEPSLGALLQLAELYGEPVAILAFGEPVEPVAAHTNGHARTPARPDIASGTPGQEVNRVEGPSPAARAREDAARKRGRKLNGG